MNKLILIFLTFSFLTSCISSKKFTRYVEPNVQDNISTISVSPENLSFDFTGIENSRPAVVSTKLKSQFIPAILYWQWDNTIQCEINPKIAGRLFEENFYILADSLNLLEKLQNYTLEITIEEIPNSFIYSNKGNITILLIVYTISGLEAIFPEDKNLAISYRIRKEGNTVKEGKITASNQLQPVKNIMKSTKKFTELYVNQFKTNNYNMTKEIAEKILTEF